MAAKSSDVFSSITAISNTTPSELSVLLNPFNLDFWEFRGTREMLEGEGIIPKDAEWPAGYFDLRWKDDRFSYLLSRQRPKGAKGPRKQFENVDWFHLRCHLIHGPSIQELRVMQKAKELKDLIHRNSAKGSAEWRAQYDLLTKAREDKQFQAFKAKIPGLIPIKRGRKNIAREAQ